MFYLWEAQQSEPGLNGRTYAATDAMDHPPADIERTTVTGAENLAYEESCYSEWQLLGKVKGETFENSYGETLAVMRTPSMGGVIVELADIAHHGWYRDVKKSLS